MRYLNALWLSLLVVATTAISIESQVPLTNGNGVSTMEQWGYTDCGYDSDDVHITSITVSPDPPQPGANLTVTVNAEVVERVEEGAYVDVVVKLGLIKLLSKTFDICEEARKNNVSISCPVEKGPYTVEHTVELPKEIPRAKFNVGVKGYTVEDEDLMCLSLTVDFMKKKSLLGW